ncbi:MAG: DUF1565 domain-containing protein [Deltaproteobacteria bacterium]|nr:DUF1565 domain-containing protein [Deltaproteobacteria bacterium]
MSSGRPSSLGLGLVCAVATLALGCPDTHEDRDAAGADAALASIDAEGADAAGAADASPDALVAPRVCTGPVLHVATSGDDAQDGSEASPWRTLAHAARSAPPGSTIHLAAGTFEETETAELPERVCLEGEGAATVVRSTLTDEFVPMLRLSSATEGSAGAQSISAITFDGRMSTRWGIQVGARSDVEIHDCTFRDLFDSAVYWGGRADGDEGAPTTYATGNSFHHNDVTNSAFCDALYCRGAFVFGGQDGMHIHHNTISTLGRAPGAAGWPIKGQVNDGFNRNIEIDENTLVATNDAPFDFAIELFHVEDVDIHHNDITGSVDTNFQTRIRVHHNRIRHASWNPAINFSGGNAGVVLEFTTTEAEIFENHIDTVSLCFMFTPRDGHIEDVHLHHNLCDGVHVDGTRMQNEQPFTARDVRIDNNTFLAPAGERGTWGIGLSTGGGAADFSTRNNIVVGFIGGLSVSAGPTLAGLVIQNNTFFDCGDGAPSYGGTTPTGLVLEGTLTSDPLLTGEDRHPGDGSPAIDSGVDIGLGMMGSAPDRGWIETD